MKVKSGQILTEKYTYSMDTTVQQFWFSKGRPEGVLELVWLTVYNPTQSNITVIYILVKHKGEVIRLFYNSTLATKDLSAWVTPVYLDDGDEIGIELDGASNGDLVEVAAQWIWHRDKD